MSPGRELARSRDAVHDLVVDGDAEHGGVGGKTVRIVALERRLDTPRSDRLLGPGVELLRGDARPHPLAQLEQDLGHVAAGLAHGLELAARLDRDALAVAHRASASSMRFSTSSIEPERVDLAQQPALAVVGAGAAPSARR